MFELLGLCLFLAALLTLNTLLASGVTVLWRRWAARSWPPATKARLIFMLRITPVLLSLGLALAFVLPAYLLHEPRHNVEPVSFKLALLTALALLGVLLALWRGVRGGWRVSERHNVIVDLENLNDKNYRGISSGMDAPGREISFRYSYSF